MRGYTPHAGFDGMLDISWGNVRRVEGVTALLSVCWGSQSDCFSHVL